MTKTIMITGATSGFGAAMAWRFVEADWRIVATGRRIERLERLVEEFGAEKVAVAPFDMQDSVAMEKALAALS